MVEDIPLASDFRASLECRKRRRLRESRWRVLQSRIPQRHAPKHGWAAGCPLRPSDGLVAAKPTTRSAHCSLSESVAGIEEVQE